MEKKSEERGRGRVRGIVSLAFSGKETQFQELGNDL